MLTHAFLMYQVLSNQIFWIVRSGWKTIQIIEAIHRNKTYTIFQGNNNCMIGMSLTYESNVKLFHIAVATRSIRMITWRQERSTKIFLNYKKCEPCKENCSCYFHIHKTNVDCKRCLGDSIPMKSTTTRLRRPIMLKY